MKAKPKKRPSPKKSPRVTKKAAPKKRPVAARARPKAAAKVKARPKKKSPVKAKVAAKARPSVRKKPPVSRARRDAGPSSRRDATGHLPEGYARRLRARSKASATMADAPSFIRKSRSNDPLAEELGEDFVKTALGGEDVGSDTQDEVVPEETGGPFVVTRAKTEFARGRDKSNPKGADREPFPTS